MRCNAVASSCSRHDSDIILGSCEPLVEEMVESLALLAPVAARTGAASSVY